LIQGKIDLSRTTAVDTNQSFPGFSYDQGNLTLIFTGETKTNSPLFTQADQISIVGTTSSIGYGSPTNNLGRTFPASGFDHISLRFTTGSVDCFVNGIPTAPNSIFPTGSFGTGDFIASNYSGSLGNLLVYNRELSDDEIYAIYSQQARRYGLIEQDKPYTVDSSVYAYTQAAGITGSSVITALDAFVVGLKANNLWNKMIAIYPFLGSDTVKTRYNLKDPSLNTTAITYSGSWSASDSGSYNNNTSSYGILENIKGDYYHPLISSQSIHLSYLSYDTPTSGGYLMGTEEIPGLPGDIAAPAAAYSVRKVRTAYTGSAMEVRRDFDDLTFDVGFDGNGNLDTGSLLTKMVEPLGTPTLPGDYSGLAAAYSLRKVSSSYSGYAVEVRRSSDNVSQSIGFDSFGNFDTASLNRFIATGSGVLAGSYSGLAAAYSLRKAVPGYAGDAIEVQSGSVSQSIGFDANGNLDTGSLLTFAGSGNAFVKTWYDQSGNNNHATQSVAASQPLIISSGSLVIENGKPSVQFIRNSYTHLNVSNFVRNDTIDSFIITNPLFSNLNSSYLNDIQGVGRLIFGFSPSQSGPGIYKGNWLTDSSLFIQSQSLFSIKYDSSNSYIYANSILKTSGNAGNLSINGTLIIGGEGFSTAFEGRIQELIYYFSDQSTNRTYIENNINSYYGIYTPDSVSTEDAFVKTWYDQSGNNRHTTQVSESRQPQIVENGTIVLDQSRPSLKWNNGIFLYNTSSYTLNSVAWAARSTDGTGFSTIVDTGDQLGISPNVYYDQGIRTYNGLYNTVGNNADANDLVFDSGSMFFNGKTTTTSNNIQTGHVGFLRVDSTKTSATRTQIGIHFSYDRAWKGYISELVLYSTNLTSSRGLIEDNINGYYNIFTHSLDSGSGYVTTWYDQSGNDRHATQSVTTDQPLILSSGSIITLNNKPALSFDGDNDFLSIASLTNTNSNSVFQVLKTEPHEGTGAEFPFSFNGDRVYYAQSPVNTFIMASNVGYTISGMDTLNLVLNSMFYSSNGSIYQNGILKGSSLSFNPSVGTFTGFIGNVLINRPDLSSRMITHELLYYTSSQISTRAPIEQNINTYFNIYTPVGIQPKLKLTFIILLPNHSTRSSQ
jgi:hypothetical protein